MHDWPDDRHARTIAVEQEILPMTEQTPAAESYELTRFNALSHGILSRYAVLPWEDGNEYRSCPA